MEGFDSSIVKLQQESPGGRFAAALVLKAENKADQAPFQAAISRVKHSNEITDTQG